MKLVVAALLVASTSARADTPVGVVVNPNLANTWNKVDNSNSDSSTSVVLAMQVDVGYRWNRHTMLGVHVSAATASDEIARNSYSMFSETDVLNYRPVDVGLSVHVGFNGPVYVAAWIGAQRGWRRLECSTRSDLPNESCGTTEWKLEENASPAFGLSVGWDLFKSGAHRFAVTGSLETAIDTTDRPYAYTALAVGIAYRFWSP